MENENEVTLIKNIQKDVDAEKSFASLMNPYGKMLYAQVIRMIKDEDLTKDIVQNVYIKVWTQLPNFKMESSFFTWIYRIAHHETLNEIAKNKRITNHQAHYSSVTLKQENSLFMHVSETEISDWLQEAVQQLPEKQALVFQLKYFQGLKFSEIATLTKTTEGALKASFHLASQKIESFLKQKLNLIQL